MTHRLPDLESLIKKCWSLDPKTRPTFKEIAPDVERMRGTNPDITPRPGLKILEQDTPKPPVSPSLEPSEPLDDSASQLKIWIDLWCTRANVCFGAAPYDDEDPKPPHNESSPVASSGDGDKSFRTTLEALTNENSTLEDSLSDSTASLREQHGPVPSTMFRSTITTRRPPSIDDGYESPVPMDEAAAERRSERRYRMYLLHPYHHSLNLPCEFVLMLRHSQILMPTTPSHSSVDTFPDSTRRRRIPQTTKRELRQALQRLRPSRDSHITQQAPTSSYQRANWNSEPYSADAFPKGGQLG